MVPFGGWEMPLSYPSGTIAEHLACRERRGRLRRQPPGHRAGHRARAPGTGSRRTLTNDLGKIGPGRAQYTHLLDDADGSVLDDIIVWWVDDETLRRHAERLQHGPGARRAIGGADVTAERAIIAVQGPTARERLSAGLPRGRRRSAASG